MKFFSPPTKKKKNTHQKNPNKQENHKLKKGQNQTFWEVSTQSRSANTPVRGSRGPAALGAGGAPRSGGGGSRPCPGGLPPGSAPARLPAPPKPAGALRAPQGPGLHLPAVPGAKPPPLRGRLGSVVSAARSARAPPGPGPRGAQRGGAGRAQRGGRRAERAQGRERGAGPARGCSVELFSAQVLSLPAAYGGSGGVPFPPLPGAAMAPALSRLRQAF